MPALWYPRAVRREGPAFKVRGLNTVTAFVGHSAEGWRAGLHSELDRLDRGAAWHCSVLTDGTVEQHYPFDAALWHGGSARANFEMIGVEHEGVAGQLLTKAQGEASVKLARWLDEEYQWGGLERGRTLFEHNEVSDLITSCPSNRIEWQYYIQNTGGKRMDFYVVRPGYTMSAAARETGLSVSVLMALNPQVGTNPNMVEAWQILRLNGNVATPPAAGSADGDFQPVFDSLTEAWDRLIAIRDGK